MVLLATTFSAEEVTAFLVEDGYAIGTKAFRDEMDRRYYPAEETVFAERDDWEGDRRQAKM